MVIPPIHGPALFRSPPVQPQNYFSGAMFSFRRGSDALVAAIRAIGQRRQRAVPRVLFPDYFCREPLASIAKMSITTSLYRVQKNLEPDWQDVLRVAKSGPPPDGFVLVHYFGFPNAIAKAKEFCATQNIVLIEDCAHMLHPMGDAGTSGAYSVFSPWKFLPIPDLGLLCAREPWASTIAPLSSSRQLRPWMRWMTKRALQRLCRGLEINWYRGDQGSHAEQSSSDSSPNFYSQQAFFHLLGDVESIAHRRQRNYRSLEDWFVHHHPDALLVAGLTPRVIPYAFPCLTEKPADVVGRRLRQRGIPAFSWPLLPDDVQVRAAQHDVAHWLAAHVLLLPIHQDVSEKQISYMQQHLARLW